VTATTTTTIQGVSVHSRQKKRHADVFDLGLSPAGIEVRRPGRPVQQMAWNRVSEWEIEERKGYVLLTLRGRGATTPLIVPGWSLDDLEILMRNVTSGALTYVPDGPAPSFDGVEENGTAPGAAAAVPTAAPAARTRPRRKSVPPVAAAATAAAAVTPVAPAPATASASVPAPAPAARTRPRRKSVPPVAAAATAAAAVTPVVTPAPPTAPAPAPTRAERRQAAKQRRTLGSLTLTWKAVVTIALLAVLAVAVTLVLLQSAGIISWGFLGPVA
jgi:hypothetical protein